MTDKEKLELIMEFLRRDKKFNKELAKIYADSGDYHGADKHMTEATTEEYILMLLTGEDFLKAQLQILRRDEEYNKQLRGINNEDHN